MIKKNINKTISITLILIFISGLFPLNIFAEPYPSSSFSTLSNIKGFNQSVFNNHFSRADREIDSDRWLMEAKLGITQAISAWELTADTLYDNPFSISEAKKQIEEWSAEELEKRFSQWLIKKFFDDEKSNSLFNFSKLLDETQNNNSLLSANEEDDNINLTNWREQTNNHTYNVLTSFNNKLMLFYPELLTYIPDDLRESTNKLIVNNLISLSDTIKNEFENIAAIEERKYIRRNSKEKNISNDKNIETASNFTKKLIEETIEASKTGIKELNTKIEQAEAGAGDLALLGEEWLKLYKEQFDKGLKAWEDAEERFIARRIEWQQDSLNLFSEGVEIWQTALNEFENQRKNWEKSAKELFEEGENLFNKISEDFNKNIEDAKKEFELTAKMRIGEGTERVKALVELYLVTSSASFNAFENLAFWHSKFYSEELSTNGVTEHYYITACSIITMLERELNNSEWIENASESLIEKNRDNLTILIQIRYFYDSYTDLIKKSLEIREQILTDYTELFESGALKDILLDDASSEDFYLDEYQLSLLKAKALVIYYEKKAAIADEVTSYINDLSSGIISESEILQAFEHSKNAYKTSLAEYETELNALTEIGNNLQTQQDIISSHIIRLQRAEKDLNEMQLNYSSLIYILYNNNNQYDFNDLVTKLNFINEVFTYKSNNGENIYYSSALDYGANWGFLEQRENEQLILNELIFGNDKDLISLSELYKNGSEADIKIRLALIDLFADDTSGELRDYNSFYSSAEWYSKTNNINISEEEKILYSGNNLLTYLYEDYISSLNSYDEMLEKDSIEEADFIKIENDLYFNYNLLLMIDEYITFSSLYQKENWANSQILLNELLDRNKWEFSSNLSLSIQEILNDIIKKNNNFYHNSIQFLIDFDHCFSSLPEWLVLELNTWKNAFMEQTAINALNSNYTTNIELIDIEEENEVLQNLLFSIFNQNSDSKELTEEEINDIKILFNDINYKLIYNNYLYEIIKYQNEFEKKSLESHWRNSLKNIKIEGVELTLAMASSTIKGLSLDIRNNSLIISERLKYAFSLYSNIQTTSINENTEYYKDLYETESYNFFSFIDSLEEKCEEITDIIDKKELYTYSALSKDELNIKLDEISLNLDSLTYAFINANRLYTNEVNKFIKIGELYDNQYNKTKETYEKIEQARFEYEKMDAVQRRINTAYLDFDIFNKEENNLKLIRAQTVLDVLTDLYEDENINSYNNPEYNELYSTYKEIFTIKVLLSEAYNKELKMYDNKIEINNELFNTYLDSLRQFGNLNYDYNHYVLPAAKNDWSLNNIINIKGIKLAFSRDASMNIIGVNEQEALSINSYLTEQTSTDGSHMFTAYELALRGLTLRMKEYFLDDDKYRQWSYAGEYLISQLINTNKDLTFLNDYFSGIGKLESTIGSLAYKNDIIHPTTTLYNLYYSSKTQDMEKEYLRAWNSLSTIEKEDLEFYLILTLFNNQEYTKGFSKIYELKVYEDLYSKAQKNSSSATKSLNSFQNVLLIIPLLEEKSISDNSMKKIRPVLDATRILVGKWKYGLKYDLLKITDNYAAYQTSNYELTVLLGTNINNEPISWWDIKSNINNNLSIDINAVAAIYKYWNMFNETTTTEYKSVADALFNMLKFLENERKIIYENIETLISEELNKQQPNENDFNFKLNEYISGNISIDEFKFIANQAYGKEAASQKIFNDNKYSLLIENLLTYSSENTNLDYLYNEIKEEITSLKEKILINKYDSELSARETEWNIIQRDIEDKKIEWKLMADLIIEKGRLDWSMSRQKMDDAYQKWLERFQNEYNRISNEWDEAYLASLEEKEGWLQRAANAVNNAADISFLSLIGTEGERLSRTMDAREPLGIRLNVDEANILMTELLKSSGITNMIKAFNTLNNISETVSITLQKGLKGNAWDLQLLKAETSNIIRKANEDILDNETKKLAYNTSKSAEQAIKGIQLNVDSANKNIQESMDDLFIFEGLWTKSGNLYKKTIVKGSTFFTPVINEFASIKGYENFILEPIVLKTNLNFNHLAALDSIAIRNLVNDLYAEIKTITEEIFGTDEESILISRNDKKKQERRQSSGKFGTHIGYEPDEKSSSRMGEAKSKSDMFYDQGKGEIGRMVSDYIYWAVIDGKGSAELLIAPWDKRLINQPEDSFFTMPTIRTISATVCSVLGSIVSKYMPDVVGMIASAAVSSFSEVIFNMMDSRLGYKESDEEAGLTIGKSFLTNLAGNAVGGVFNGFMVGDETVFSGLTNIAAKTVSPASEVAIKTSMAGAQTATASLTNNIINGITIENGTLGYNTGVFNDDYWNSLMSNTFTTMTSTLVSSSLSAINTGTNLSKLDGFNNINQKNVGTLNNLVGSIAGQTINYTLGNDFTLNLFNAGFITNGMADTGLIELHLGRDGASMNVGSGGANVSIENIIASIRGGMVWNVNNRISSYGKENDFDALITLRAQNGYGDNLQKDQLQNILNGNVTLNTEANGNYSAETTIDENGKRLINLAEYTKNMSKEDQMRLAVILGHEAYRDGIITDDNYIETRTAVSEHTLMALKMIFAGEQIALDNNMIRDIIALNQGTDFFNNYVDAHYDSSADYWKLTKQGNLLYDGKVDLYDEDGRLLKEATNKTLSHSLAEWMGISQPEAKKIMQNEYGMKYIGGTTWTEPSNEDFSVFASSGVQAAYELQWRYIDQVNSKFNGSMVSAIEALSTDLYSMFGYTTNYDSIPDKYRELLDQYNNIMKFAIAYDSYISSALNNDLNNQYTSKEAQNAYMQVITDLQNKNYTDSNSLYTHYAFGGILFNIDTDVARTSTMSAYSNGKIHRFGPNLDGLSIDTANNSSIEGDNSVLGKPVYTTQYEVIKKIIYETEGYGMRVQTQSENATNIYAHLIQEYRDQTSTLGQLNNLWNLSQRANVYILTLPPGTNIGRVGSTGNSTGPHLHYEMRVR